MSFDKRDRGRSPSRLVHCCTGLRSPKFETRERVVTYDPIADCMMPVASSCSLVQYSAQSAVLYFRPSFPSAKLIASKYSSLCRVRAGGEQESAAGTRTVETCNPIYSNSLGDNCLPTDRPRFQSRCCRA